LSYHSYFSQMDMQRLPRHIAVIMDGNGRWSQKRGMIRGMGHKAGAESLRAATELCRELNIEVLTVYAFSTENWKRPAAEIELLFKLFSQYLDSEIKTLLDNDIQLVASGDISALPEALCKHLQQVMDKTAHCKSMKLNLALNYGGRQELTRAMQNIALKVQSGELQPQDISMDTISGELYTAGMPDPDLLIRPSGELRLSNFLLWQCAYSEFYFDDVMWPDFGKEDLCRAIIAYQQRDRRFGAVGEAK